MTITKLLETVLYYMDDILIRTSKSLGIDYHLYALKFAFFALKIADFRISRKKTEILKEHITYLGYKISANWICMPPEKQSALVSGRIPKNLAELSSRVSQVLYFSKFLPKLSQFLIPLKETINSDVFSWPKVNQ